MHELRYLLAGTCEQVVSICVAKTAQEFFITFRMTSEYNSMDAAEYNLKLHRQFTHISFDILKMQEKISFIHQYQTVA